MSEAHSDDSINVKFIFIYLPPKCTIDQYFSLWPISFKEKKVKFIILTDSDGKAEFR